MPLKSQNNPHISVQNHHGGKTTKNRMKVKLYMLKMCHMLNKNHNKSERSSTTAPLSFHLMQRLMCRKYSNISRFQVHNMLDSFRNSNFLHKRSARNKDQSQQNNSYIWNKKTLELFHGEKNIFL